ncbi:hypothetical protein BASA60_003733, partial [Batrachochytrium salamandrivorans]
MKVNVLVVAAMVITSVNASWFDSFMGYVGRICRLESASSRDFSEGEWGGHDLKGHGTVKPPDCDTLFSTLKDLQTSIFLLFGKYLQSKSTISRLDIKIDNSKPRKANKYRELQSIAKATME